jgi:hypothetical protein
VIHALPAITSAQVPAREAIGRQITSLTLTGLRTNIEHSSFRTEHLQQSDAMLIVGSSLMVYSGFRFVQMASRTGMPIAAVRRFCIAQASSTAMSAHSNRSAAPRNHHARSRAISMSMPETLPGRSLAPRALSSHGASARRSRCGSHI